MQIDDVPLSDAAAGTWQAIEVERALGRDAARPEAMAMQHRLGKLSARERIARLTDPGSFHEVGALVRSPAFGEAAQPEVPGDGVVSGTGRIAGRPVVVSANDFTVMGGSSGKGGGLKTAALVQRALDHGLPYIVLLDGGGHRIQEGLDSRHFAAVSSTFQPLVDLSGWVPMVAAMMGSGFASPSNMAGLSDFGVMVRKHCRPGGGQRRRGAGRDPTLPQPLSVQRRRAAADPVLQLPRRPARRSPAHRGAAQFTPGL